MNYFIFIIGLILAACLYTLASFLNFKLKQPLLQATITAMIIAALEYAIKIPMYHMARKTFSSVQLHNIWAVVIFIIILCYQKFILNQKLKMKSVIVAIIIVIAVIWESM